MYHTRKWTTIELDGYENLGFLFRQKKVSVRWNLPRHNIIFPGTSKSVRFYRGTKDPQKARAQSWKSNEHIYPLGLLEQQEGPEDDGII